MQEKLPEHIDQLEDFYKTSFIDDQETPSPELWGKIESRINIPAINATNNLWKNGLLGLSIETLILACMLYYFSSYKSNTQISPADPLKTKEIQHSEPQHEVFEGMIVTKDSNVKVKEIKIPDSRKVNAEIKSIENPTLEIEEIVTEPEKIIEEEKPQLVKEPAVIEPAVVKEEPKDLYSKLKKKHVVDSTKSLFIEKKK